MTMAPPFAIGIDRYHRMIAAGIFEPSDPVELINGVLVQKFPRGDEHAYSIEQLSRILSDRLLEFVSIRIQAPITLGESEPEPDLVIAVSPDERNRMHPCAHQTHIVIEVSESSLIWDRSGKRSMYASAGIREYWIVNLIDHQVEVYIDPIGSLYRTTTIYTLADSVPLVVAGQTYPAIPVKGMM